MSVTEEVRLWEMERRVVVGMYDGYVPTHPMAPDFLADTAAQAGLRALRQMQSEGTQVPGFNGLMRGLAGTGDGALAALEGVYPVTRTEFDYAVREVSTARIRRSVREAAYRIARLSEQALPVEELEREAQTLLGQALLGARSRAPRFQEDRMADLLDRLLSPDCGRKSITTGWPDLDRLLGGGIEAGNLVLIGARPSMGKSAFALQMAQHMAKTHGPVLFQSCEMSESEVTRREVAQAIQTNSRTLAPEHVTRAIGKSCPLALYTDNRGVDDLTAMTATFHAQHPDMSAVYVDYLGLLQRGGPKDNTEAELSYISRSLKHLAERHQVPVIAVHQLNRGVEARVDKRPQLSDLRGSGAIEQDANIVMFLFRPGYYEGRTDDPRTQVRVAKARDGATYTVDLRWTPETVTFHSLETRHQPPAQGRLDECYGDYDEENLL
jgi:replicative DNA helicase